MSTLTRCISIKLTDFAASAMLHALVGLSDFNDGRSSLLFWRAIHFVDMLKVCAIVFNKENHRRTINVAHFRRRLARQKALPYKSTYTTSLPNQRNYNFDRGEKSSLRV